jgi:hypothetical protein
MCNPNNKLATGLYIVKFYNLKTLQKNSTLEAFTSQEGYAHILELVNYHQAMSFVGVGIST